jgi:drug/metabolite transporter (DMT)-like permease
MNPTAAALWSEGVLSLYPILVKSVNTNLFSQLLARFGVFPLLALLFGSLTDLTAMFSSPLAIITSILTGLLTLGHVGTSYLSFSLLPAGTALALFYTYPLFNLLAGALLFGESISPIALLLIGIAMFGVYLIATHRSTSAPSHPTPPHTDPHTWGVIMGLLAALTETMFFIFIRSNKDATRSPFYAVQHLYLVGFVALLAIAFKRPEQVETSLTSWASLLGFNALLGFTGYVSRFYAIPKLFTTAFSLLSFMGVAFGFAWGILFTKDRPSTGSIAGGLLIALAVSLYRWTAQ